MKSGLKCEPTITPDDIDIPALREKYRQEAEKRRRSDGNSQYIPMASGEFAQAYETDLHSPPIVRDPISEDTDVVVLGAGFAGLLAASRLKQAGVANMRIIDIGGDFGGGWYWNRFPGVQCDVESYTYLPLLEEVNYVPKDKYSYGPEILEHCQRIGRHFGLYEHALFQTVVRTMRWDKALKRWRIATNRGDEIRARFLVMGPGPLNNPKLPAVPGLTSFKGCSFHSSRWDYKYTGGDTTGGLDKLADKRVAVIGTGATGIQIVPQLAKYAKHLYVFQRTPSSIDERGNQRTDPEWARALKPGWQAERQRCFHSATHESFAPDQQDIVCDGWTELNRNLQAKIAALGNPDLPIEQFMTMREEENFRVMERLRRRVDSIVTDPETAEALKAWFHAGCKRPCFSDEYLPVFNRPNVTLVDVSAAKGIEGVTEKGIVANGAEYEVDCIIYASGFEVTDDLRRRFAIDAIDGREGLSLYDHWGDRLKTLHGMSSHGFPNFFFTGYGQGGVVGSITLGYDVQARHIAHIVKETMARGAVTVEPSQQAQDQWLNTISENFSFDAQFTQECTPSYLNHEGEDVDNFTVFGEYFGGGYDVFLQMLKDWRDSGMEGMMFSE